MDRQMSQDAQLLGLRVQTAGKGRACRFSQDTSANMQCTAHSHRRVRALQI